MSDVAAVAEIAARLPEGGLTKQVFERNVALEKALRATLGATRLYHWKIQTGAHPDATMAVLADTVEDICRPFNLNPSEVGDV